MRSKLGLAALIAVIALPSWAARPWSTLNGFYAGMSKQEAIKAGAERCRQGQSIAEHSDSIYCFIPANALKVASVRAEEGKLEFEGNNLNRVKGISLKFKDNKVAVTNALDTVFGKGQESFDNSEEAHITEWQRGDANSIELRGDGAGPYHAVYVEMKYDASVGKARKADAAKKAKMAKTLDSFNKH